MDDAESLSHTKWECKYHLVFIPKYRRKALYGELRRYLGEVFRRLAEQKECKVEEGHLLADHVHMMILDSAEILGGAGGRVHQGEKRHPPGPGVRRAEEKLHRAEFLGAGLLRLDGRSR